MEIEDDEFLDDQPVSDESTGWKIGLLQTCIIQMWDMTWGSADWEEGFMAGADCALDLLPNFLKGYMQSFKELNKKDQKELLDKF